MRLILRVFDDIVVEQAFANDVRRYLMMIEMMDMRISIGVVKQKDHGVCLVIHVANDLKAVVDHHLCS